MNKKGVRLAGLFIAVFVICFVWFVAKDNIGQKQAPEGILTEAENIQTEGAQTEAENIQTEDTQTEDTTPAPENVDVPVEPQSPDGEPKDPKTLAMDILETMTLEEKIYQMFIVTQEQLTGISHVTQSGETSKKAIESHPVGGIIYFAKNLVSREQCISMISNLQEYSGLGLFIAVDEEGGTVARLGNNAEMGTTSFHDMKEIGDTQDTAQAYNVGYTIGTEIAELGFNLDFAPVADVFSNPENTVIGTRAFSDNPETAAEMVSACVRGFNDSGILCTLKHFPGHGDTIADSHYGEAEISKTLDELYECELIPFQAGIEEGAAFVMIGHLTMPQVIEENVPATLSYDIVTGLLREELGFEGIIITDSMSMKAITDQYSSGEAATMAVKAGVDIILMPYDLEDAVNGIMSAIESGEITEERINESVLRILEIKIENGIIEQ